MRRWPSLLLYAGFFTVITCAAPGACVSAAAAAADAPDGGGCVEVEINGARAQSLSCLGDKLLPPRPPRPAPATPALAAAAIAQRPSNQLGLYNRAATGHRMGNAFGTSVLPQRPPPPPPAAPLIAPRR